ncbi:SDR family NAD(P)-dependent oxidoreductase [Micromonospora ureilytica]|uniref:SDR family NAD(P)-dependent oxidoreductase n=1 Tax=Micromonospora ureilytica TaxID=709868 RepID=UPI004039C101
MVLDGAFDLDPPKEFIVPTIAIVGAGPGLGMEIARAFGRRGFAVALLARDAAKLETLAEELGAEGIVAAGFTADILKPDTVTQAFIPPGPSVIEIWTGQPAREHRRRGA